MPSRRKSASISSGSVQRFASARMRRFSLLENCRRLAVATTSGSGTGSIAEVHRCLHLIRDDSNLPFYADSSKIGVSPSC
jgi:hypothetical protein